MAAASATRTKRAAEDPTQEFFDGLAARGHELLLEGASGSIRFDLSDGTTIHHWTVTVKNGDVKVSKKEGRADSIVAADRSLFDRLTRGRENAMAATLRGVIKVKGDLGLMLQFQRIFPGPPGSQRRAHAAVAGGRSR
jgi:hypothetical protein